MNQTLRLKAPFNQDTLNALNSGDTILLSGTIFAARDAAHKKMIDLLDENKPLPFNVNGQIIYYVGPCPAREGEVIGSAGPTTSSRMDAYAPRLIELGLKGMIGKGMRSPKVVEAMVKYGAIYLGAVGGAGAAIARCIKAQEIIAFPELGPESIRKLTIENFPLTVIIDSKGYNLYEEGKKLYRTL
jgi:fumarate hydratase subunit beta